VSLGIAFKGPTPVAEDVFYSRLSSICFFKLALVGCSSEAKTKAPGLPPGLESRPFSRPKGRTGS